MKKLLTLILIASILAIFSGCKGYYQEYEIVNISFIPDSNKIKYEEFLVKIVEASNEQHSAGNSKNKGHILRAAGYIAIDRFQITVPGLEIKNYKNSTWLKTNRVKYENLSSDELEIYNDILKDLQNGPRN